MQAGDGYRHGFTLIELMVVISVISLIMAFALPALNGVKRQAKSVVSMNNQRQIATASNLFATENHDRYPESVATIGFDDNWNWTDPTRLTGNRRRSPQLYRAMSEYLRSFIADASIMYCPGAPREYTYLQQSWEAGDNWDNPETSFTADPVGGTYCFYWNYRGYLGDGKIFRGPSSPASSGNFSKLLVSDYFGYNHWRSPNAFGSCEKFESAAIIPETYLLSSYWSLKTEFENYPEIKLRAAYTDGHVETYSSTEVVPMKVSLTSDGSSPYPDDVGPGVYFLPQNALN
ncbi:MAG: type II secretion system protein [Sedimentisphaerales bacterium]|nr:type II secretion system protein [Sedimentisphaerales bacterium]